MLRALRAVAVLNAIYLGAVGALGTLWPGTCAALFHIGIPDNMEAALVRLLCALMLSYAVLLWKISRLGPQMTTLAPIGLAFAVINLFADVASILADGTPVANLIVAIAGHAAMAGMLLAWMRRYHDQPVPLGSSPGVPKNVSSPGAMKFGSAPGVSKMGSSPGEMKH